MSRRLRMGQALALSAALLAMTPVAQAFREPEPGTLLPDYDARLDPSMRRAAAIGAAASGAKGSVLVAGPVAEPGADRHAALKALENAAGTTIAVRWSPVTGSPGLLMPRAGFLSAPDARAPESIAREFVLRHRALWRLDEEDVARLETTSVIPIPGGGAMIWFEQRISGLDVLHGHLGVGVARDGRVSHASGADVTGMGEISSRIPEHSPGEALVALADAAGTKLAGTPLPIAATRDGAKFSCKELRDDVFEVRLVVAPTAGGPRLAWVASVALTGSPASYEVAVDDATLLLLRRASHTAFLDTRGLVFAQNPDASPHAIERFVDRDDYRSDFSPLGWTSVDLTEGNNTVVRDDIAGDDELTLGSQARATPPGAFLFFDAPWSGVPATSLDASLTGLFRNINVCHDHFHALGFDEASGGFQADNFGRGGLGGDPVLGDCQDGSGTDNANFQTPPDGDSGRMQMFLWGAGAKDSALDMGVVMHEYVHGVSTRLVGGPSDVSCLAGNQGRAMGEGWGDYFGASYLGDPVIGAYVSGDPVNGIRAFRLDDNPPTGKDYRSFCTFSSGIPDCPPFYCEEHVNGEMWSGFLWLVREAYVAQHGPAGARLADRLIVDGLKLTACSPSMLDARDAIILADRLETGGVHECLIKEAARDRWMGFSARPDGGTNNRPIGANDPWPECVATGTIRFTRAGLEPGAPQATYSCDDLAGISVTDGNGVGPIPVTLTSTGGDSEVVLLAAAIDPAVFTGSIPVVAGLVVPGDGIVQAIDGETLTATYVDPDRPADVTTDAVISCTPRIAVARHFVRDGSCDADTVASYPDLPGFVDKGESANVEIQVRNFMPVAIAGEVSVTCDRPDLLTILPSLTPLQIALPAAIGSAPGAATLVVRVLGSDTIGPTDETSVQLDLSVPGFAAGPAASFRMLLGRDYELVPGAPIIADVEAEVAPVGPLWSTGTLALGTNQWSVVTCNAAGGAKAYHDGPTSCSGNYSDAQGDPWLAAPALGLADAGTATARILQVAFQHDCDLGSAGLPAFGIPELFDAEMVLLMVSNNPGALDASEPFALFTQGLALYANLPLLGITSNTTGYARQVVAVQPGQLGGVDFSLPAFLTWYFLTDVTPAQCPGIPFPLDDQAEGYYVDDVEILWEKVQIVPSVSNCIAGATVYSYPVSSVTGSLCPGSAVTIDASRSESVLCPFPPGLEYRFLVAGVPVACLDAGGAPRVQDVDGWGLTATCEDSPARDTTYVVEVRCGAEPTATDARAVTVRVLDGLVLVTATPQTSCAGSATPITLDAGTSSFAGCPGVVEYRFSDAAGGPLDCDGDTLPDGFGPSPTCDVAPTGADRMIVVEIQCSTIAGCVIADAITLPAIDVLSDITEASAPPSGFYCVGTVADLTGATSIVTGCAAGVVEYRWTSGAFDTGWTTDPLVSYPVAGDANVQLEVRCSLDPACTDVDDIDIATPSGTLSVGSTATGTDCPGDPFTLTGLGSGASCSPPSQIAYRFLLDADQGGPGLPVPIACIGRTQDVDGWGIDADCDTTHPAGGGDYVVEMRCSSDPACTIATVVQTIVPRIAVPTGTVFGTLFVSKSAAGCPAGGDVVLAWPSSDYLPQTYVTMRCEEPSFGGVITGYPAPTTALADGLAWSDTGAACDGGGGYRGPRGTGRPIDVYFYVYHLRDGCTDQPILPDPP